MRSAKCQGCQMETKKKRFGIYYPDKLVTLYIEGKHSEAAWETILRLCSGPRKMEPWTALKRVGIPYIKRTKRRGDNG